MEIMVMHLTVRKGKGFWSFVKLCVPESKE